LRRRGISTDKSKTMSNIARIGGRGSTQHVKAKARPWSEAKKTIKETSRVQEPKEI